MDAGQARERRICLARMTPAECHFACRHGLLMPLTKLHTSDLKGRTMLPVKAERLSFVAPHGQTISTTPTLLTIPYIIVLSAGTKMSFA